MANFQNFSKNSKKTVDINNEFCYTITCREGE